MTTTTTNLKRIFANGLKDVDFSKAHQSMALFVSGPFVDRFVEAKYGVYGAKFKLGWDISPLFPYINAIAETSRLYAKPNYIKFILANRLCALHPREGAFTPVKNLADAHDFLSKLSKFVDQICDNRDEIIPDFKRFKPVSPLDIYRLLPGTNCRRCGHATCLAFAAALSRQMTSLDKCPHLASPVEENATFPIFDEHGNCIRTVSLAIDTSSLRQKISRKEADILRLQSELTHVEDARNTDFNAANARLPSPLTQREIEVLQMIAQGATNKKISLKLRISEHTVKSHVIHIFNKLGVNDRTQASVWAASKGLLLPSEFF